MKRILILGRNGERLRKMVEACQKAGYDVDASVDDHATEMAMVREPFEALVLLQDVQPGARAAMTLAVGRVAPHAAVVEHLGSPEALVDGLKAASKKTRSQGFDDLFGGTGGNTAISGSTDTRRGMSDWLTGGDSDR